MMIQGRRFSLSDSVTGKQVLEFLGDSWMGPGQVARALSLHQASIQSFLKREVRRGRVLARQRADGLGNLYRANSPMAAAEHRVFRRAEELVRELKRTSVGAISRATGIPPEFPQLCDVRIAPDLYERATMLGVDEEGEVILRYADGSLEVPGLYGWDDIFVPRRVEPARA